MDGYKPSEANAEDPMSVGVHVTFGKFRTIHLGDATKNKRGIRQREAKERRERSRNAAPLPDGMELRLGDCRKVLADVSDNSGAADPDRPALSRRSRSAPHMARRVRRTNANPRRIADLLYRPSPAHPHRQHVRGHGPALNC
jgi:hypothetical protein